MDIVNKVADNLISYVNDADPQIASARVESLRQKYPESSADDIADIIIRGKCLRAGSIGAITSSTSIIPGVGTVAALTFGAAADISLTFKLQAELVLEIAATYDYALTDNEKRVAILTVTGLSAGSDQMLAMAGETIAKQATERLTQKSISEAIPFLGVAVSGGTNTLVTYLIGRRAQTYFKTGPESMQDWSDSLRSLSGVDERLIVSWLSETTVNSWELMNQGMKTTNEAVIVAGQSTGKVLALGVNFVGQSASQTGSAVSTAWQRWRTPSKEIIHTEEPPATGITTRLAGWFNRDTAADDASPDPTPTDASAQTGGLTTRLTGWFNRSADAETPSDTPANEAVPSAENQSPTTAARIANWFTWGVTPSQADLEAAHVDVSTLSAQFDKEQATVIGVIGVDEALPDQATSSSWDLRQYVPEFSWWNQTISDQAKVSTVMVGDKIDEWKSIE